MWHEKTFYLRQVLIEYEIPDFLIDIEAVKEGNRYHFNNKVGVGEGQGGRDDGREGDEVIGHIDTLDVALPLCDILEEEQYKKNNPFWGQMAVPVLFKYIYLGEEHIRDVAGDLNASEWPQPR